MRTYFQSRKRTLKTLEVFILGGIAGGGEGSERLTIKNG